MSPKSFASILARYPFCHGMSDEALDLLAGCAENVHYADGEHIFKAHSPADHTYLIRAGRVAIELHGGQGGAVPLETAEEGEIIGWALLFPPYQWQFDAIARGPVRALRFDGECLRNKCETDPAFGYDLLKRVLYQAIQRLERSHLQALDLYGSPGGGSES